MVDLTLVTGIVDIGRAALPSRFARPFESYRDALRQLLDLDVPMVVYADSALGLATPRKTTRLVAVERADLEHFPHFEPSSGSALRRPGAPAPPGCRRARKRCCRTTIRWSCRSSSGSPSRRAPTPSARATSPGSTAGVTHTVRADLLHRSLRGDRLLRHLERFLFLCYPYAGASEIHGFERAALARYANVEHVEWVARGGFFGGRAEFVVEAARLYDVVLRHTLEHGYMGTEESVFTILALLHPGMFDRFRVA